MKLFYSAAYDAATTDFETMRKARWIADSFRVQPIAGVEVVVPPAATVRQLRLVHSAKYLKALKTGMPEHLASSQGFRWEPGIWTATTASTGGVIAAALEAQKNGTLSGSLSAGLHHARYDSGGAFCAISGLALAAKVALAAGAQKVLIADLDCHAGGGTDSLVGDHPQVHIVDISMNQFDCYTPRGNNTLDLCHEEKFYLPLIEHRLKEVVEHGPFDLCLYNAGVDVHGSVSADTIQEREELVAEWLRAQGIPGAFVLAGGYLGMGSDRDGLVRLHRMVIEAFAKTSRCY